MPSHATRTALQIALGGFVFLATARLILGLASYPPNDSLWAKLQWVEAGREEHEVLFFGSSRIQSGIVPEIFDRVAAENGWDVRSFNLAADGAEAQDVDFLVRRALEARPPGWRYAVIEARPWLGRIWWENALGPRSVYFHDFTNSWQALYAAVRFGHGANEVDVERLHLLGFSARLLAAGRGPDAVRRLRLDEPPWRQFESLIENGGYRPPEWTHLGAPADCFRPPPETDEERRERARLRIRRSPWTPPDFPVRPTESLDEIRRRALDEIYLAPFRRQQARLEAAGIVPIFFTPSLNSWTPDLAEHGVVDTFFAYDDPEAYSELVRPEHRYDCSHLDDSGARIFSRLMARDLARWVRSRS